MKRNIWQVVLPLSMFVAACHVSNTPTTAPGRSVAGPEPTMASLRDAPLAEQSLASRTTAGANVDTQAVSGTSYAVQNASAATLAAGSEDDVRAQARTSNEHTHN